MKLNPDLPCRQVSVNFVATVADSAVVDTSSPSTTITAATLINSAIYSGVVIGAAVGGVAGVGLIDGGIAAYMMMKNKGGSDSMTFQPMKQAIMSLKT